MSNTELEAKETMATYREKIIRRINDIDDVNCLKESWGYDMKKYYELDREEWIKAINNILSKISDCWILWQIYRCAVHMTEED